MNTSSRVLELTDENFAAEVEQGAGVTVVDFWAPWCGPCRFIAPVIEQLAGEYEGRVRFGKLNVDEAPNTAAEYGIRSIPTIGIFKDGVPVDGVVGAVPKPHLAKVIEEHLSHERVESR
jgi:thioredoxin 1